MAFTNNYFNIIYNSVFLGLEVSVIERKGLVLIQLQKGRNKVGTLGLIQPFGDAIPLSRKDIYPYILTGYILLCGIPKSKHTYVNKYRTYHGNIRDDNFQENFSIVIKCARIIKKNTTLICITTNSKVFVRMWVCVLILHLIYGYCGSGMKIVRRRSHVITWVGKIYINALQRNDRGELLL